MRNIFKSTFNLDTDKAIFPKSPIILGFILIYLSTVFVQSSGKLSVNETAGLTIVMIIQLLIYLFSRTIFKEKYWIYFIIQGIITMDYGVVIPNGYETLLYGIIPTLIIQSMLVYSDGISVVVTAVSLYGIFCGTIIYVSGVKELVKSIPLLIIITIAMRAYLVYYINQIKLRFQTQKVLQELEHAYERVEELTLINERQRMARDLHDTLSQGLAGIIMQLEAVKTNLNNNNITRAQEIVEKSMGHARRTLADSRLVIDDLRLNTKPDNNIKFIDGIQNEIASFKAISSTFMKVNISIHSQVSLKIYKHSLYIVREALNNIAKHAKAENTTFEMIESNGQLSINITDDGIGFDVKLLDKLFGHYGIIGITERVKAIDGKLKITSQRRRGTNISIIIPIEKENNDENE